MGARAVRPLRAGVAALGAALGLVCLPAASPASSPPPAAVGTAVGGGPAPAGPCGDRAGAAGAAGLDPERVRMASTRRARGGSGVMTLRLSSSTFGVALSEDGSYRHHVEVAVEDLPPLRGGSYVVWAATPDLDRHARLGSVDRSGSVSGEVAWNKFLVFVTAEDAPDVKTWSQTIVLSARSPSGRMHTMRGHGPFSGEPCLDPRP